MPATICDLGTDLCVLKPPHAHIIGGNHQDIHGDCGCGLCPYIRNEITVKFDVWYIDSKSCI